MRPYIHLKLVLPPPPTNWGRTLPILAWSTGSGPIQWSILGIHMQHSVNFLDIVSGKEGAVGPSCVLGQACALPGWYSRPQLTQWANQRAWN